MGIHRQQEMDEWKRAEVVTGDAVRKQCNDMQQRNPDKLV